MLFACACSHSNNIVRVYRRRRQFVLLRRFAFYFWLLLVCGDFELNPGPDNALLKELLSGQKEIKNKLSSIENYQAEQQVAMIDLKNRLSILEATINKIEDLQAVVSDCRAERERNRAGIDALIAKVDDIENKSRRNNLVFYGVEDNDEPEKATISEGNVKELCELHLGMQQVGIERAH